MRARKFAVADERRVAGLLTLFFFFTFCSRAPLRCGLIKRVINHEERDNARKRVLTARPRRQEQLDGNTQPDFRSARGSRFSRARSQPSRIIYSADWWRSRYRDLMPDSSPPPLLSSLRSMLFFSVLHGHRFYIPHWKKHGEACDNCDDFVLGRPAIVYRLGP